jgi:hypothetical protein
VEEAVGDEPLHRVHEAVAQPRLLTVLPRGDELDVEDGFEQVPGVHED